LTVAVETSNTSWLNFYLANTHLPLVEVLEPLLQKIEAGDRRHDESFVLGGWRLLRRRRARPRGALPAGSALWHDVGVGIPARARTMRPSRVRLHVMLIRLVIVPGRAEKGC
jgi:hypothetical protein